MTADVRREMPPISARSAATQPSWAWRIVNSSGQVWVNAVHQPPVDLSRRVAKHETQGGQ